MGRQWLFPTFLVVLSRLAFGAAAESESAGREDWLMRAREAQGRGLIKKAIEMAGRAVEAAPRDPRGWFLRAELFERTRQLSPAEADLTRVLELVPDDAAVLLKRGTLRLRLADYPGALSDFDRYAAQRPSRTPDLWQRGIALFFLGRLDDARRQFELHRLVNPRDVENSAWHFACVARLSGLSAAREQWMPVQGDRRVPMAEIQRVMTGGADPGLPLATAEKLEDEEAQARARFYAHLYLALFHGCEGKRDRELRHAAEAAKGAESQGIMGEIARLYADWVAAETRAGRR